VIQSLWNITPFPRICLTFANSSTGSYILYLYNLFLIIWASLSSLFSTRFHSRTCCHRSLVTDHYYLQLVHTHVYNTSNSHAFIISCPDQDTLNLPSYADIFSARDNVFKNRVCMLNPCIYVTATSCQTHYSPWALPPSMGSECLPTH
jgi:hypothetical protein